MDKLQAMRIFMEVVERGGFARAAGHLGIAPAVVTRNVASLEKRLGTPLLVRTTRRLTLTERGEIYLKRVKTILAEVADAESSVGSAAAMVVGTLRIAVTAVYGLYVLPALLSRFKEQYPQVQFDILLTDDPVDFIASGCDVYLALAENVTGVDVVVRKFGSAETILCATPSYLARSPRLDGIDDLRSHQRITVKRSRLWNDTWQLAGPNGELIDFSMEPAISCNTTAMVYQCVLNGLGIGRLPALLAKDVIETGNMRQVLGAYRCADADLVITYPGRFYLTSKARVFIDFILANAPV
ncbi:LysR family transcriptional regulator [Noviherbaspirillum galbum]|uniref:LysR family transcriptional regulator n=1 Tax=Noviherbaspirillum galbum TaxID=2709383 RepID=A0A6B3SVE4_9BURK|nr:LysR family transcriptional regulator [Noviherbaspirillum galbum]NEX64707.1 LysR family transcriptional regulator [Noviherbaspirillum galbum]